LEQMPHLLNFLSDNGTLSDNEHTILISHTAGGILSSLTGLYPDRNGQSVANSYGYFRPDGSVGFSSSFKYWTDNTDGGNPANNPPTPSADPNYNMVNGDAVDLGGTGAVRNTPAPWVPYTRAGCDVGVAIHCAQGGGICNANAGNARTDVLPDEKGGYAGFKGLFGTKYVNPALTHGAPCVSDTDGGPIKDPFGQCGFPGFDGMLAKN